MKTFLLSHKDKTPFRDVEWGITFKKLKRNGPAYYVPVAYDPTKIVMEFSDCPKFQQGGTLYMARHFDTLACDNAFDAQAHIDRIRPQYRGSKQS